MCPPLAKMTPWTRFGIDSTSLEQMFFTPLLWNHTFITIISTRFQLNSPFYPDVSSVRSTNFDWVHVWRITRPIEHADIVFLNEL
jgi:hypothetical protein